MANAQINYKKIVEAINSQFQTLQDKIKDEATATGASEFSIDLYNETKEIKKIIVEDEQMFIKDSQIDPNNVYVVLRFGSASINFAASIFTVTLMVWGTENKVKPTQMLLSAYCSYYNMYKNSSGEPVLGVETTTADYSISNVTQLWATPTVSSNFNSAQTGFRNILTVGGTLVIGQETVEIGYIRYYYGTGTNEYEDIGLLAFNETFSNSNSPQPFPNTQGFAISETNFATYSFSISTYVLNNHFVADLMSIKGFQQSADGGISSSKKPNDPFKMEIHFTNGFTNDADTTGYAFLSEFKCISCSLSKQLGGIMTLGVGFSR